MIIPTLNLTYRPLHLGLTLLFVMMTAGCQQGKTRYQPSQHLDEAGQTDLKRRLARYIAPPPEKVRGVRRFDDRYTAHYDGHAGKMKLRALHPTDRADRRTYFLVSRLAPSLRYDKFIAVGGYYTPSEDGQDFGTYREVFWTWKLPEPELETKSSELFNRMVRGEELSSYYPNRRGEEEWIEFPDDRTRFDTTQRVWQTLKPDSLARVNNR